jgi:hypothetical protein
MLQHIRTHDTIKLAVRERQCCCFDVALNNRIKNFFRFSGSRGKKLNAAYMWDASLLEIPAKGPIAAPDIKHRLAVVWDHGNNFRS